MIFVFVLFIPIQHQGIQVFFLSESIVQDTLVPSTDSKMCPVLTYIYLHRSIFSWE